MNKSDRKLIEELFAKQTDSLNQTIDKRFEDFGQNVDKRFENFGREIDGRFDSFGQNIDGRFDNFGRAIDTRFREQEERLEKRMIQVIKECFEQIVLPHIMDIKNGVALLNTKFDGLNIKYDRMERKLDAVVDRQDRQAEEIKNIKKFTQMPEGA